MLNGDDGMDEKELIKRCGEQTVENFKARMVEDIEVLTALGNALKPIANWMSDPKNEVSAFLGTDLDEFLRKNYIKSVVLAGMQTHMCLEGGTRSAHDLGYQCTVISDACATRDLKFEDNLVLAKDVHHSTLATLKSYALVMRLEEYLNN